jgi:hypothetical protein
VRRLRILALSVLPASAACGSAPATVLPSDPGSPLIEGPPITLPDVAGRIDHLAGGIAHHRVFVAEVGNGSVEVVNLDNGTAQRISGLRDPQGLAYLPGRDELVVASGGDGTVRFYDAGSLALKATGAGLSTRSMARTGLFVRELDRLRVAAPAEAETTPASLIVLRPAESRRRALSVSAKSG